MPLRVTGGRWQLCPFFFLTLFPCPASSWQIGQAKESALAEPRGQGNSPVVDSNMGVSDDAESLQGFTTDHRLGCSTIDSSKSKGCRSHTVVSRYRLGSRLELVGSISGASSSTHTHTHTRIHTTPALMYSVLSLIAVACARRLKLRAVYKSLREMNGANGLLPGGLLRRQ